MSLRRWMEILKEAVTKQRKHAPFFSWFDRSSAGKGLAEAGAVQSLLESMERDGRSDYSHVGATGTDWPDCEARNATGQLVAFEVTELVDPRAVAHPGRARLRSEDEIVSELETLLAKKDQRSFHGGRYAEVVLLVHTDEPYVDPERTIAHIRDRRFTLRHRNLTRVFLLFGYSPKGGACPYVELRLAVR